MTTFLAKRRRFLYEDAARRVDRPSRRQLAGARLPVPACQCPLASARLIDRPNDP
jgi:hypothetical protein